AAEAAERILNRRVLVQNSGRVGATPRERATQRERVDVLQRRQSFRAATHVVDFHHQVSRNFVLEAQVVLVGIRRVKVWVHEVERALVSSKRNKQPGRRIECGSGVGWLGRKGVAARRGGVGPWRAIDRRTGRGKRRFDWKVDAIRGSGRIRETRETGASFAVERWRAIELQVVFAF